MAAIPQQAAAMPADAVASARACTLTGTAGPNRLAGTRHDDVICGRGGADRIRGNRGHDLLRGGGGRDVLQGKTGADDLRGGSGADNAFGGAGADDLRGGRGDDGLGGGLGPDDISGGAGRDIAFYGQRRRRVRVSIGKRANDGGAREHDNVRADVEDVRGGRGNDVLTGNGAANTLFGGGGRDRLVGKGGSDTLDGGRGNDRIDARDGGRSDARAVQGGSSDRVSCGGGEDTALVDPEDIVEAGCEHVVGAPQNRAPTGIALADASVAENQPAGTIVGTLSASDPDPGDTHTFALVPGAGSADNGSFQIVGSTLRTAAAFDFETKHSYSVRIRATDHGTPAGQIVRAFTITVDDANEAPTGLTLTGDTVAENAVGTTVGTVSVSDVDTGQSHAFTLVAGTGDTDNAKFSITGSTLSTAQPLDFETSPTYSIRVRATDDGTPPLSVDQVFTITATDAAEPPSPDAKTAATDEDTPVTVTLSATDPEGDDVAAFVTSAASHGAPGPVGPITCGGTPNVCTATVLFTPDADYNGPAGFSYTASDGTLVSTPATVAVTVDPVDDVPLANPGSRTTDEDTPLTLDLASLVSDVETADDDLTYEIVSGPAHGAATATTYTPAADFNGTDSLTYRVTDRGDPDNCAAAPCDAPASSTTETVTITVTPVNDTPDANPGSRTTDEDTPLALDLASLVSDVETADGNLTYEIVTPPAHGIASATTYTPAADFNGTDTFTYRVTDRGDPDNCGAPAPACDGPETSTTETVTITVDAVNDAPVNTLPAGPVNALQNTDTPIAGVSVADVDAAGDVVQVTFSVVNGTLTVNTLVPGGVVAATGNGTSTVVLQASQAAINATLADANGLVFRGTATGPDTLTMATDDQGHNGSGGPETDTDTLAIVVNSPPNVAPQSVTTDEDTPKTITLSATDADGDAVTFAIGTGPSNGSLGAIGAVTCDGLTPNTCTADVLYTPAANFNGTDSFTFTATDGITPSAPATVSITVDPVNDAPRLENIEGTSLPYTENDPATLVTASTTVTDADSANFDTGTLTVDYSAGGTADDRLAILDQGQIAVSGADVTHGGTPIGSFTGGTGTTALVVTLNASATPARVQDLVRAIAYSNVSDSPSTAARTVRFVLSDGDGGTSAAATRAIALTAVNDPPVLAGIEGAAVNYVESVDSPPSQSQVTNTLTVSDPDNANLAGATITITGGCQTGEDSLVFSDQNGISGSYDAGTCTLTLTGSSSVANYQAALRSVNYQDSSDAPNTATRTVTFQVDDGQSAGHASNSQTRDITVTASNDSPVAGADPFTSTARSALANTTLAVGTSPSEPAVSVSDDVLANDTDPDSPHAGLTASAGSASTQGGVVAMNPDGTFTYTPAPGFTGSDTITYTVHDNDSPDRTATGTITINVVGPTPWYVDDSAPSAGADGTSAHPLTSLAPLTTGGSSDSLDGTGDRVFVYSGTYTAGIALENAQKLLGQPQGLAFTDNGGRSLTLVAAGGSRPAISSSSGAVVGLASGNELQDLALGNAGSGAASLSGTGVGTATVADTDITNAAGKAVDIDTGTLAMTFGSVSSAGSGTEGVKLTNVGGNITMNGGSITNATNADVAISQGTANVTYSGSITDDVGSLVSVAGTTGGTKSFGGAITDGNDGDGNGVSLTNNTGATINFTGGLVLSTGSNPAFAATGGGTVTVTDAGTGNTIATTTATALNVANTTIGAGGLTFKSISAGTASGSAGNGIVLDTTGATGALTVTGTGTAGSGGTIQHKTGADSSTTAGIGIYLNSTRNPSFSRMQLNDFDNFAIRGTGVNGFTLSDSTINGSNGTSTAADEASVAFDNLTGSASVTNANISGGVEDDVRVQNTTGSLSSLSVTGSTFATTGAATANDALALLGKNGAAVFNATVQNNTFNRAQGDLYQYTLESGSGTMHFDSNTVKNDFPTTLPAGGGDINVSAGSIQATPNLQYSIDGNSIFSASTAGQQPPNGSVVVVAATPQGSATGTIQNNVIGTTGVTQSGGFDSILADAVKAGVHTVTIRGNTIRRYKEAGIRILGVSPAASPGFDMRATVKGNTITEPDSIAFAGIDAEVGADPADVGTMCLDLGGTTAADKNSVSSGDPADFNDINLIQQFATGMNLPGYAGSATDDAAVGSFIAARNNGDGIAPTVSAIHDTTTADGNPAGSGFTGTGTNCQ